MADEVTYPVGQSEVGSRLDRFLAQRAQVSRHEAMRLIEAGAVRVGAARAKKGALLRAGRAVLAGDHLHLQAEAGVRDELPDRDALGRERELPPPRSGSARRFVVDGHNRHAQASDPHRHPTFPAPFAAAGWVPTHPTTPHFPSLRKPA